MRIFLSLLVLPLAWTQKHPFDFVEDALPGVNKSADPCDDFYRHACPLGSPSPLISSAFEELIQKALENQKDAFWKHLDLQKDEKTFSTAERNLVDSTELYSKIFNELCHKDFDAAIQFLGKLKHLFPLNFDTSLNLTSLEQTNCADITNQIKSLLEPFANSVRAGSIRQTWSKLQNNLQSSVNLAKSIALHLDVDVREGIAETKKLVESMVAIAEDWIKDTPWAKHYNALEQIKRIADKLRIHDEYGKDLETVNNFMADSELVYSKCKNDLKNVEHGLIFCQIYTAAEHSQVKILEIVFLMDDNAYNMNPIVIFGFPNYYHMQYGSEMASKLGYTGYTVGHELGHTFIDNFENLEILPVFSHEAQQCILNQFNKTCKEFREISCNPGTWSLDDDGADTIGLQFAYEMLTILYEDKLQAKNERLGIPNDQLFFYSYAFNFCSGYPQRDGADMSSHSVGNIRINVAAQHPGFKKAFGCSDDSRMMRSATKQCVIYGKDAPETRRINKNN